MNRFVLLFAGSAALALVLILFFMFQSQKSGGNDSAHTIRLFCAAGIKEPVRALAREYEETTGAGIEIQYGGSGALLAGIEAAHQGDLYIAADESYIEIARRKGLAAESIPLAWITPGIAVPTGNPKKIKGVQDLLRENVKLALANPDAAAIGRITKKVLSGSGTWAALEKKAKVFKPTVNELATDVAVGAVDAAFVWDAVARQYDELAFIEVKELTHARQKVSVGVLASCEAPAKALGFARFLGSVNKGKPRFDEAGFAGIEGDIWEPDPRVLLFSGAMLRAGVEEGLKRFEDREGVTITRVYNGCGVLVSQIKGGSRPDAYLSCDIKFMEMVKELFDDPVVLTENDIVIATAKGNPHKITCARDLARKGLRIGLGHHEKSALGFLTRRLLEDAALYESISKNTAVESATADFLVAQILAGALDSVIVYRSNVMSNPENLKKHLDIIPIELPGAMAEQPWAIARQGSHRFMLERLFNAITSKRSRERFESIGFRWRMDRDNNSELPQK